MKTLTFFSFATAALGAAVGQDGARELAGTHIVLFKKDIGASAVQDHHEWLSSILTSREEGRGELKKRGLILQASGFKDAFQIGDTYQGYFGHFDDSIALKIKNHPDVAVVEPDSTVCTQMSIGAPNPSIEGECRAEVEKQAPWGLARISNRQTLNFGTFNKYNYNAKGGEGVDVYVVDTGINIEHVDFEGRAAWGETIVSGDEDEDDNGHGSHCAGIIAGKKYGVAKKAKLISTKVLRSNGCGVASDVIKGLSFAVERHKKQVQAAQDGSRKGFKGSVVNLSLAGDGAASSALSTAADAVVEAGVHVVAAAGNDNAASDFKAPASSSKAITVGASALDDSRAYFSNYGASVNIFAPGLSILSTWIGSRHAVNTISGTSMASAHLAGLAAYYLGLDSSEDTTLVTPESLRKYILSVATKEALSEIPDNTSNLLAWNGAGCDLESSLH